LDRRKKRGFFDDIFEEFERMLEEGFEEFKGFEKLLSEHGGYTIHIEYKGDKPIIHAKLSGDIDPIKFRKQLKEQYPEAEIVIEGGKPLIEEVHEESKEEIEEGKAIKIPIIEKKTFIEEIEEPKREDRKRRQD